MGADTEINEVRIEYCQKTINEAKKEIDIIKNNFKDFELSITKTITTMQTKMTIYTSIAVIASSYFMKIIMN
jgi:hypothetical protein